MLASAHRDINTIAYASTQDCFILLQEGKSEKYAGDAERYAMMVKEMKK